jgi:hypothetical protein
MKNIYQNLRLLAKSVKSQNLFLASKEINGINLFRNLCDFSKIQQIYISYLYNYDNINRDIVLDKISKHVFDSEINEDAYLFWKRNNAHLDKKDNKQSDVNLVVGNKINFPTKGIK